MAVNVWSMVEKWNSLAQELFMGMGGANRRFGWRSKPNLVGSSLFLLRYVCNDVVQTKNGQEC